MTENIQQKESRFQLARRLFNELLEIPDLPKDVKDELQKDYDECDEKIKSIDRKKIDQQPYYFTNTSRLILILNELERGDGTIVLKKDKKILDEHLTRTPFQLLKVLATKYQQDLSLEVKLPGRLSYSEIYSQIPEWSHREDKVRIQQEIKKIKEILGKYSSIIKNIPSVGYRLDSICEIQMF